MRGKLQKTMVAGCLVMLGAALVSPAGAHVNKSVSHVYGHLKPKFASPGTINSSNNPVDWTKLKNVPAGLADGVDDAAAGGAGDITAVLTGTGLTGGGQSGDLTLSVDTNAIQRRVSQSCPSGQAMSSIGADGLIQCIAVGGGSAGPGDITAVNTGFGLLGGVTTGDATLAINPATVQRRVGTGCTAANQSIKTIAEDGSVTCEADDVGTSGGGGTGISGVEMVTQSVDVPVNGTNFIQLQCPVGKKLLTGGTQISAGGAGSYGIISNHPLTLPAQGWDGEAYNNTSVIRTLSVFALCAVY